LRAMNRRTFIGTSIAAAIAASRPAWSAETHHIERVGLQLYTVRDLMKQDFEGTLAKVAQIGYKEVESAGYLGKSPQEVAKFSTATSSPRLPNTFPSKRWKRNGPRRS